MKLVDPANKVLLSKLEEFDFNNPPTDPVKLANDLIEVMREGQSNGLRTIGLAANQLGLPYRVMVIEGSPAFVCFNPKLRIFFQSVDIRGVGIEAWLKVGSIGRAEPDSVESRKIGQIILEMRLDFVIFKRKFGEFFSNIDLGKQPGDSDIRVNSLKLGAFP